jgi:hypothetical protein
VHIQESSSPDFIAENPAIDQLACYHRIVLAPHAMRRKFGRAQNMHKINYHTETILLLFENGALPVCNPRHSEDKKQT